MKNKAWIKYTITYICDVILALLVYYITLPPINVHAEGFWVFLTFLLFIFILPVCLIKNDKFVDDEPKRKKKLIYINGTPLFTVNRKTWKSLGKTKMLALAALPIAVIILGSIFSSTFFNARRYAAIINVTEATFREDMPESDTVTNIALMDSATAAIVGNRTLGSLSHVVSQYEISPDYTQINYHYTPKKVANLEYADFFKWLSNRKSGIPGYVMVDPVLNTAEYKEYEAPALYSESGFFGDDLVRRLRFDYPTKIFGDIKYEVDDEGNPFYVVPCLKPKVFLFGALDVHEVILFNPCTGASEIYAVSETPTWIDSAFDGYLAMDKYNWKGLYSGGWFNSVIGNKDCKVTTDDFGYIVIGDDVWYFTGVTSVNSDRSNIGFIISNARTGEYKYYAVSGAEEHSAMAAAEGEVQEKGYEASFPALVNVKGEATYIMVLKDAGGLVKLYALVNVEKYNLVATGETQEAAMRAYTELLLEEGVLKDDVTDTEDVFSFTVSEISSYTIKGESYLYFKAEKDGETILLKCAVSEFEELLLVSPGETLSVKIKESDKQGIFFITSVSP